MMRRLRCLLLLLAAGCTAPAEREAAALQAAMDTGRAGLAAIALPDLPPAPAAVPPPPQSPPRARLLDIRHVPARPTEAAQLLGAGPEALRRWLGEPSLRRAEGDAEVWLYAAEACALDLVLYPAGGGLRVAHAAARANGAAPRTEAACLSEIAAPPGLRLLPAAAAADRGA
ncbi:hypothetical protein [Paracraurococcus lichenis]|uniref:Lipoprotein n=1 Tax=Paracraurococcus lichenis TaxID=3064888 RepID=A0ABT9E2D4_9PROT|nr:hypothetical protein [Paracraurococcus sp. LOR1-02]MDO9710320.1 hypothetical protein [Paracraurococcus sp. LOR1-02]